MFDGIKFNQDRRAVMSLVHVLKQIFGGLEGDANLNIDVAIIFHKEVGIEWDDPAIVKRFSLFNESTSVIAASVQMCVMQSLWESALYIPHLSCKQILGFEIYHRTDYASCRK